MNKETGNCCQFADTAEQTRQDLAEGRWEVAAQRLHRLRGNVGILGAQDLMELAGELEEAIMRGETELEESLTALDEQLAALIAASAPLRDAAV